MKSCILSSAFAANYSLKIDGSAVLKPIPHFWSECVGTGTMEYCLKPAWQVAARIGAQEAGFKRVRGHGIFIHGNNLDSIKVLSWKTAGATPTYNWSKIDAIYDTVLSCGLKPIVETSFMPTDLQSNGANSKPKDWNIWQGFIAAFVSHLEQKYGAAEVRTWYFEIWNEPDYSGFWKNTIADYDTLYSKAVAGLRSVDTNIIVGGPAATNSWPLQDFVTYCQNSNTPVKFLSNHLYGGAGGDTADAVGIRDDNHSRSTFIKNSGKKLFSLNTEFNSTYSGQGGYMVSNCISMDGHKNAPFVAKVIKLIIADYTSGNSPLPDVLSYWTISDCFDEWGGNNSGSYIEGNNKVPFGEVFGLINYQGVRKATFNAYKMLHMMGTGVLSMTGGSGDADGVDGFATVNSDTSQVAVLVYDYFKNMAQKGADDSVTLTLSALPFASGRDLTVRHYRIDTVHSNPYQTWVKLGKSTTPSTATWDSMHVHENLEMLEPQTTLKYTGADISKTFSMPRWSVSLLTLTRQATTITPHRSTSRECDWFTLIGQTLTVSHTGLGPVDVSVFGADGRIVKHFSCIQRSINVSNGLAQGLYVAVAEAAGTRLIKKIAVY